MSSQGNRCGKNAKKQQKQNSNNKNAPGEKRGSVSNKEMESLYQLGTTQQPKPQGSEQSLPGGHVEYQASGTQPEYSKLSEHNHMEKQPSTHTSTSIEFEIRDLSTCGNCMHEQFSIWEILKEMIETHPNKDSITEKLRKHHMSHAMKQPEHQTSRGLSADAAEFKQKSYLQPEYNTRKNTGGGHDSTVSSMQSSCPETIANKPLVDFDKDDGKMDVCSTPEEEWENTQDAVKKNRQEEGSQSYGRRTSGDRQQTTWGKDKGSHSSEKGHELGYKKHRNEGNWRENDNGRQHNNDNQQGPGNKGGSKYGRHYKIVKEVEGDLFEAPKETSLAHCVATDMRMGSGIAVTFRQMFKSVSELLDQRARVGQIAVLEHEDRFIYYLVTKKFSNEKPLLEDLISSLEEMRDHCARYGVKHLAMPRIGCGLDRLEWSMVKPKIEEIFSGLDISITIYNFNQPEKEEDSYSRGKRSVRVINRSFRLVDIEAQTALIYFGSEDGYVDECGKELDNKFHFMQDYRTRERKVGNVIRFQKGNEVLYGLIVKKKQNDEFSFMNFELCLIELRKMLKKDRFEFVGFEAFRIGEDHVTMEKIMTVLKNIFAIAAPQIHVCWPKLFEGDCRQIDRKP